MVREEVIIKVEKPTAWVNAIVVIENSMEKSESVWIRESCIMEMYLNITIRKQFKMLLQHYKMKLSNSRDSALGFHQNKLTERSPLATTFETPYGRYKIERIPFRFSSESGICQRTI